MDDSPESPAGYVGSSSIGSLIKRGTFKPHRYVDAHTVAKLIFRTYQQHQDDTWTAPALDLIDRLCLEGTPGTADELERFER